MNQQQLENLKKLAQKADNERWPGETGFGPRFARAVLIDDQDLVRMFQGTSFGLGINSRANISGGLFDITNATRSDKFKIPYPITVVQAERFNISTDGLPVRSTREGGRFVVPNISIRKAIKINEKNR